MRYLALACDYDGTLAHHGRVSEATVDALDRVRASGRRLLLVSGRELEDLQAVFEHLDLFDRVVLENGALLYRPAGHEVQPLTDPPPAELVEGLRARGVTPLSVGRCIVATWHPQETVVMEVIAELGLELQVIFNKGAVMVLPSGINKATGLRTALAELDLSPHNVVGVGDAENDHTFLQACECAVAVANALPTLAERCDFVTAADHGEGVVELAAMLVDSDLEALAPRLGRHELEVGTRPDGTSVTVAPYGTNLLLTGPSASGKSTLASGLLERAAEQGYQFCVVDPEGDYEGFGGAVTLGDSQRVAGTEEVLALLAKPDQHAVVNLLGVPHEDRPGYFDKLLPRLLEMRARTGRPHWLLVDEAHHMLPAERVETPVFSQEAGGLLFVTVHPSRLAVTVLSAATDVIAVGDGAAEGLGEYAAALGQAPPPQPRGEGDAVMWPRRPAAAPFALTLKPGRAERQRHRRKYAEGELGPDKSFWFRGPDGALRLQAQNLVLFVQLADGVDDGTWLHHLRAGDYSRWFREAIKDEELAREAATVEADQALSADESRGRIRTAIEERYTLPA